MEAKDVRIKITGMKNLVKDLQKNSNPSQLEKDTIA